jgi:hypothetical protein
VEPNIVFILLDNIGWGLDIDIAHGSPVSLDYYDEAPFKFNGIIELVQVE